MTASAREARQGEALLIQRANIACNSATYGHFKLVRQLSGLTTWRRRLSVAGIARATGAQHGKAKGAVLNRGCQGSGCVGTC